MRDGLDELKARQAAARRARAAAERNTGDERAAHIDAAAIANCHLCDDDGYRGNRVCSHTDHAAAARRGMALVRRVMGWNNHRPTTTENHRPAPNHTNRTPFTRWNAIPAPKRRQGGSTVSAEIGQCGQCGLFIRADDRNQHAQWHQENEQ